MIRSIRVKNFVHFYDEYTLSFVDIDESTVTAGPYFFIGQNESGKSCMFEALRRCMSTSKNLGTSTSHKHGEDSLVICDFDLSDGTGEVRATSGIIRIRRDKSDEENMNDLFVKFVFETGKDQSKIYVDLVKKERGRRPVNEEFTLDPKGKKELIKCLAEESFSLNSLLECVHRLIVHGGHLEKFSKKEKVEYTNSTNCEQYLLQEIDRAVVVSFPVRSVAAFQWTNSSRYGRQSSEHTHRTVIDDLQERSEIVFWYFNSTDGQISPDERIKVDRYFKQITNNYHYTFKKEYRDILVYEGRSTSEKPHTLDKVPEGYFEAQNCAILLAMKQFKTICLEEAGRGMNPQMVERMRDLVLKGIKDKVILVTSHIPSFLAAWNVPRVFFFRRLHRQLRKGDEATSRVTEDVEFSVVSGRRIIKDSNKKAPRIFTNQECATMFFSRRVLFVEGSGDHTFTTAMKLILLDDESLRLSFARKLFSGVDAEAVGERFYQFMSSLQVVALNGQQNKQKFNELCHELSLEHYFLLDYNAIFIKDQTDTFRRQLKLKIKDISDENLREDVTCLEAHGIFVWKKTDTENAHNSMSGNIEGALISLVDGLENREEANKIKDFFKKNKVPLKWDPSEKKDDKYKLFTHRDVTDENVHAVVKKVLDCSLKGQYSDILRFLSFFFTACERVDM